MGRIATGLRCRLRPLHVGRGSPVHVVLAEFARDERTARGHRLPLCLGSGRTSAEASRRACGEAVERLCGFFHGDEPRIHASHRELDGVAIHPNTCLLFSRRQYRERRAVRSGRPAVPRPFDSDFGVEWSPLWSVTSRRWRLLPTQLLYYRYPVGPGRAFGRADSNGAAAGRSAAEAALRGLLEVVERDSVALWWYNRASRPSVALDDIRDPYVRRLCEWYSALGRECWALDLTSDLGIPVVAAVSRRCDDSTTEELLLGFGAHRDRERAAIKALLEMNQMLAVAVAARRGLLRLTVATRRWLREATLASEPYLGPHSQSPMPLRAPAPPPRSGSTGEFGEWCDTLARHGLDVLVTDQSRPRYGCRVVKVVVPGLRPWWPRFAPGRLYDAPVAAGWRSRPRAESRMNPRPIFF